MTVPTQTPGHLSKDLIYTLDRLRHARILDPKHEPTYLKWHRDCEVCKEQRRFDWLTDQLITYFSTMK